MVGLVGGYGGRLCERLYAGMVVVGLAGGYWGCMLCGRLCTGMVVVGLVGGYGGVGCVGGYVRNGCGGFGRRLLGVYVVWGVMYRNCCGVCW